MELTQLDLFSSTKTQNVIERDYVTQHRPLTLINSENYIQFQISVAENEFIKFNDCLLYLRMIVKCEKTKPEDVIDWTDVAPVNFLLNTLFNKISVSISNTDLTDSMTNYMYKTWFEGLLAHSRDAKEAHFTASGWYDDVTIRSKMLNDGKEFELYGPLGLDLTHQPRAYPGPCTIEMKLDLNQPEFVFLSKKYRPTYQFTDVYYSVHRTVVSPSYLLSYKQLHSHKESRIPFVRSYCRAMPIKKNTIDESLEDVCRGHMPKRVYLGFVDNEAFNGSYKEDPFKLEHFNLNFFACYIDGIQYPTQAYQPHFDRGLAIKEYMGLVQTLGQDSTNSYARISYEDFKSKYPIFAVSFEPDLEDFDSLGLLVNPRRDGILRIKLRFGNTGVSKNITAIVYLEFDSEVVIDKDHNVTLIP